MEGLGISLIWSQRPGRGRKVPIIEEVNQSQRREPADVAVEADPEDDEIEGQGQDIGDRGRGRSEARGRGAGKDPTGLEVEAEAETVGSPKAAEDAQGRGPGPMTEAGRSAEATMMPSLLCSRKYQVNN